MPTYVILMNWTDQGVRADKETVHRRDQADALAEKHGARIEQVYWTMVHYDIVTIIEAPDDETATAMMLELTSAGNLRRLRFAPSITTRCRRSSNESAHPPVHEEELLLEAYPANREAHAPHICDIALRPLLREGSVRPRGTINVWGVCEHLRLGPFSSLRPSHLLAA